MEINFRHEINGIKVITAVAQDWKSNEILMLSESEDNQLREAMNYLNSNSVEAY